MDTRNVFGMSILLQKRTNQIQGDLVPQPVSLITHVVSGFSSWFHYASDWFKNNISSRNNSEWSQFSWFLSNVSNPGHLRYNIGIGTYQDAEVHGQNPFLLN